METPGVSVVVDPETLADMKAAADSTIQTKVDLLQQCTRPTHDDGRRVRLHYNATPVQICGDGQVDSITFHAPDGQETITAAGLVIPSIGYAATSIAGLPFDAATNTVPNDGGRVLQDDDTVMDGIYVTGWIRRGSTGGIGMNKLDAREVARAVIDDFQARPIHTPREGYREDLVSLLDGRGTQPIGLDGWQRINNAELDAGHALGRTRLKLIARAEMHRIASAE